MDTESKHSVKIRGKTTGSVIANVVSLAARNVMQIEIGSEEIPSGYVGPALKYMEKEISSYVMEITRF